MMDTEIDDGHGQVSSMRVTLRWARKWGPVLIVAGVAVVAYGAVARFGEAVQAGLGLAALGAGLPAAVAGCKAVQSHAEAREALPPAGGAP